MSRRFFRRLLPSRQRLHRDRWFRMLGRAMQNPSLWHLNRHSVARGMAAGLWWAFIPVPGQTLGAALFALRTRGNVPLAVAATWVTNPLTMVPSAWVCYEIGLLVTRQPRVQNFLGQMRELMYHLERLQLWAGAKFLWHFARDNVGMMWPFWVGCLAIATISAALGYLVVQWLWRGNLVRRWRKRGHRVHCRVCHRPVAADAASICPHCGARSPQRTRIGLGIAAAARLAARRKPEATPP